MSLLRDLWNGARKLNIKSAATFVGSAAGTAFIGAIAGPRAASIAGLVAGLIVSQHRPVLEKIPPAPAGDGAGGNAALGI